MSYHYEKLCPLQVDYPTIRTPKQLIYNYIAIVPWKYDNQGVVLWLQINCKMYTYTI
jgi:hypothetical protein